MCGGRQKFGSCSFFIRSRLQNFADRDSELKDGKVYHQQYQQYEDFTIYFILVLLLLLIVFFYYEFGRAAHRGACGISIGLVRDSLRGNNKRGWSILEPIISLYTIERSIINFVQYIYFKITTNGRTFHLQAFVSTYTSRYCCKYEYNIGSIIYPCMYLLIQHSILYEFAINFRMSINIYECMMYVGNWGNLRV